MITVSISQLLILCFAGLLCWALVSDALTLKIPNRISIGIAALYPAWVVATWPRVDQPFIPLLLAIVVLAVGFLAFSRGLIGGGDAKLLAAVSLWAGPQFFVPMITTTALAGGVIVLAVVLAEAWRRRVAIVRGEAGSVLSSIAKSKVPYGMAIAAGGGIVAVGLWTG